MKKKIWYNVELNGGEWYTHLSENRAEEEAIRARKLGLGMAYVVQEVKS
jgi:hypothetical protein